MSAFDRQRQSEIGPSLEKRRNSHLYFSGSCIPIPKLVNIIGTDSS